MSKGVRALWVYLMDWIKRMDSWFMDSSSWLIKTSSVWNVVGEIMRLALEKGMRKKNVSGGGKKL